MTDYSELKRLAEALVAHDKDSFYLPCAVAFERKATPEVVLELIAENERLRADLREAKDAKLGLSWAIGEIMGERDKLKDENEVARMRIKELDLLFGRYILAMRAAIIEEEHGLGAEGAMMWIYNSLAGPGELPPENETLAQAYFDREIVAVDNGMQEVLAFHDARRFTKETKD